MVIAATCVGASLYFLRGVLVPFILAVFLSLAISPVVDFMARRLNVPRGAAVTVTLALAALGLITVAVVVGTSITELATHIKEYEDRFQELLWSGLDAIPESVGKHLDFTQLLDLLTSTVRNALSAFTNGIFFLLSQLTIVFLFLLFILLGDSGSEKSGWWGEVEGRTQRYLFVKTAISGMTGVIFWSLLTVAGVELALVFGLLAFLLNYIPNVGSVIATFLPIPLLVFSPNLSFGAAVGVLILLGAVQFVIGNLVEPKVFGETLDMNPVVVLLSLLVWGALWGVVGMVLAVPITATLTIAANRIEAGRAILRALTSLFFSAPDEEPTEGILNIAAAD